MALNQTQILSVIKYNVPGKSIKLLIKIFSNILKNPNEQKFKDLNLNRIKNKLNSKICIDLLISVGFCKSDDKTRLLFDKNELHNSLLQIISNNQTEEKQATLHNKPNNQTSIDIMQSKAMMQMKCMGFDEVKARTALIISDYDINKAVYHLIHGDGKYSSYSNMLLSETNSRCNILHCVYLDEFVKTMKQYDEYVNYNKQSVDIDSINIQLLLDQFLHLLHQHSERDDQFEFIMNQFKLCDMNKCNIFSRNYRDRRTMHANKLYTANKNMVFLQILDKMHCFYQHCHDIGNRILIKDKMNEEVGDEEKGTYNVFVNKQISKILQQKVSENDDIKRVHKMLYQKYNQLFLSNEKKYDFGIHFKYGYSSEKITYVNRDYKPISPKYSSLKEEVTSNNIAKITIMQFDNEYKKAKLHLNSHHCKTKYPHISIENILSLMIYCNYTNLQYKFSKTYRENTHQHENFYHLGKYLKISVYEYGTQIRDGNVKRFYHGIADKLLFPQYLRKVHIQCPLSTSSVFAVAVNFTDHNKGLVIDLGGDGERHRGISCGYNQHFSVSWLSDYANESEYFFIQNATKVPSSHDGFSVRNIINPENNMEYVRILDALSIMNEITSGPYNGEMIEESLQTLIISIIENQLSDSTPFKSLDTFSRNMINIHCWDKTDISIDYSFENYSFWFGIFFDVKCEWIKINVLNALYPNMKVVRIWHIKISAWTINSILLDVKKQKNSSKLVEIQITPDSRSLLTINEVIYKYQKQFNQLKWNIIRDKEYLTFIKEGHVRPNYVLWNSANPCHCK